MVKVQEGEISATNSLGHPSSSIIVNGDSMIKMAEQQSRSVFTYD